MLIFFSSGLFLGFSLGANDSANVFGTAVASRMVRFATAAILASIFILLGAVISGTGAAHGLGELGAVNALAGAFTVALCAAITVYLMTKAGLPVSTTQAVVGAIVGWNHFSGSVTDMTVLGKIVATLGGGADPGRDRGGDRLFRRAPAHPGQCPPSVGPRPLHAPGAHHRRSLRFL
jgi:PiT family inorganic phosphate transporter